MSWRAGRDSAVSGTSVRDATVDFRLDPRRDGTFAIRTASARDEPLPLWLAGRIAVEREPGIRVLTVDGGVPDIDGPAMARVARDHVRDVVTGVDTDLTIVSPRTSALAADLVGRPQREHRPDRGRHHDGRRRIQDVPRHRAQPGPLRRHGRPSRAGGRHPRGSAPAHRRPGHRQRGVGGRGVRRLRGIARRRRATLAERRSGAPPGEGGRCAAGAAVVERLRPRRAPRRGLRVGLDGLPDAGGAGTATRSSSGSTAT